MPRPQHLLIYSERSDVLERIYDTPFAQHFTITLASDVERFSSLAQRFPFHGVVVDIDLAGNQLWDLVSDIKLRHPTIFTVFLSGKTQEEQLRLLKTQPGWAMIFHPLPWTEFTYLFDDIKDTPLAFHQTPEAAEHASTKELGAFFKDHKMTGIPVMAEIPAYFAKNPKAILIVHTLQPDTATTALLRDLAKQYPASRILIVNSQPLDTITRHAVRNNGWSFLPYPISIPFLLDQMKDTVQGLDPSSPENSKIMVVDDEPNLLDFMVDILSEQGYKVDGYPSGTSALAGMKKGEYHIALVDFQLGDMTGLQLGRELRQMDEDLSIILITAHASLDMAVKAIQADVYDYLIKPVDTNHLKRSLNKGLEKRRLALEIKALVADLQKANYQLNRLNDLKTKFLSIVTHDLRTPLTSIKGYAQVINMQDSLPKEQMKHFLGIIAHEADHLGNLINDLMDFVSIDAGKLRVEKVPMEVVPLIESVRDRISPIAASRKLNFAVDLPAITFPTILGDKRRLEQVLTNLLTNAFKHTPADGKVTLKAAVVDEAVRMEIVDTGEGIPPGDLPHIFEQFYQVESHASKREGIGLGLNITKEIVQAHGGQIGVHSAGKNQGAQFWFTIPITKDQPPAEQPKN
ncbi:MAG TPA: response regulator [Elusimicrobiota bacterium]|nr:response regulator [Elusimicrobiota bacterium]